MIEQITIRQYQDLMSINDSLSPLEKKKMQLSIIKKQDIEEIEKMSYDRFMRESNKINAKLLRDQLVATENKINHKITLPSGSYYLLTDWTKFDSTQIMQMLETSNEFREDHVKGLHQFVAILCVERKLKLDVSLPPGWIRLPKIDYWRYYYDHDRIKERAKEIRDHVKIIDIWSAFVFFYRLWSVYGQITEHYLNQGMIQVATQIKELSAKNSDGSQSSSK